MAQEKNIKGAIVSIEPTSTRSTSISYAWFLKPEVKLPAVYD